MPHPETKSPRTISRRSFLKRGGLATIGFLGLSCLPFYSYYKERLWLDTVELELRLPGLPEPFRGLKVVHFSDVHYGFHYGAEEFEALLAGISVHQPDLIVFTGDLFDGPVLPYRDECVELLSRLRAPLGQYAVMGNHDYYTGRKLAAAAYADSGFELLTNRSAIIRRGNAYIQLVGLDDMLLGRPDLNAAFSGLSSDAFTLLLAHEPDFADRTSAYRVDLQLSGHSHGGQFRLPLIGEIMTPPGGKRYVQGLYELEDRDVPSDVYTNRGIGTTHIPVRFLCRPELTVITLQGA